MGTTVYNGQWQIEIDVCTQFLVEVPVVIMVSDAHPISVFRHPFVITVHRIVYRCYRIGYRFPILVAIEAVARVEFKSVLYNRREILYDTSALAPTWLSGRSMASTTSVCVNP